MVPGNDRHVMRGTERLEPDPRGIDLLVQRQIDQVSRKRDMVGCRFEHVLDNAVDDVFLHRLAPPALPVHIAGDTLRNEIPVGDVGKGTEMQVGEMRKPEHPVFVGQAARSCQARVPAR